MPVSRHFSSDFLQYPFLLDEHGFGSEIIRPVVPAPEVHEAVKKKTSEFVILLYSEFSRIPSHRLEGDEDVAHLLVLPLRGRKVILSVCETERQNVSRQINIPVLPVEILYLFVAYECDRKIPRLVEIGKKGIKILLHEFH